LDIHYTDAKQCAIGRQAHICHLNANEHHMSLNSRKLKLQRETIHKIEVIEADESA
jgi:hypothetical protein